ncbi:MAG: hypothetical protein H0V33_08660 [Acidimicrobiia bacterium]|nr:hypothetical protein [Acidimicrobiia bacterium]
MAAVLDAVAGGRWFDDRRHPERRLRVTRHAEGTVVVSLWRGEVCSATFRLDGDDAPALLAELAAALIPPETA